MTVLPQSNATLLEIRGAGFTADADRAATTGTPKWAGAASAYVRERNVVSTAAQRLDRYKRTQLIIPGDLRPAVELQSGDTVIFDYAGAQRTRVVQNFAAQLLGGVPQTIRIELADE